ncbi:MAG: PASTA domain-containing protein [Sporolactobacillus sp.]|nr:PASTA domain-containing protein [Sporolactobacillus sp.]
MFQRKRRSISYWSGMVGAIFMLTFFILIGRFVYIAQGGEIGGHKVLPIAKKQWTSYKLVDEKRGSIYSENGSILAEDVPAYTLYAVLSPKAGKDPKTGNYRYVRDKAKTARELAPILGMKESDVLRRLNKDAYQVEFGAKGKMLGYQTKRKIDRLKLPGINYQIESKRYYPAQSGAAYTIGFTQTDQKSGRQRGVFGVEQEFDRYLEEQDGTVRYYRSTRGVPIPDESQQIKKPVSGNNVYLTLNSRIQTVLEQAMTRVGNDYKPKSMIGIVADPKTGRILAMSTAPSFNPNKRNIKQFSNLAIASAYEPGSVMKTFTIASAIDAGVYQGKATYKSGSYKTKGGTIHDWNRSGWGNITFDQGFKLSSNVGMSVLTDKYLGADRLGEYLKKFGFMRKTGIDLPGEQSGFVNWTYPIDKLEASFGQASSFTAMQIVQAATAIANDGKMMRPYVVEKVVNPKSGKTILSHRPQTAGHPISELAAEKTRRLMRQVVSQKKVVGDYGATGLAYDLPGYDVAGKTGTAQIAVKGHYLPGKNNYVYSFLGMAPEKDPKLIVYVAVKQPHLKPTDLGAEPVVDIVRPVMSSSLQYFQVEKKTERSEQTERSRYARVDDLTGASTDEAARHLKQAGLTPVVIGNGSVVRQSPASGTRLLLEGKVMLYGSAQEKMPDIRGWSLADVMKLVDVSGMKLTTDGDGFVTDQSLSAGSQIKKGETLKITLRRPTESDSGTTGSSSSPASR